eukprot:4461354-Amphidinium_carterae.1
MILVVITATLTSVAVGLATTLTLVKQSVSRAEFLATVRAVKSASPPGWLVISKACLPALMLCVPSAGILKADTGTWKVGHRVDESLPVGM